MTSSEVPGVLVVDDTPALLDLARDWLEDGGYRVYTCLHSREAVALARKEKPDIVMLDVAMPELSGWEVLARFRADPALTEVPVIICTAYVDEALGRIEELRGPRGDRHLGFLPKPFDGDELLEVVASILGRNQPDSTVPAER